MVLDDGGLTEILHNNTAISSPWDGVTEETQPVGPSPAGYAEKKARSRFPLYVMIRFQEQKHKQIRLPPQLNDAIQARPPTPVVRKQALVMVTVT